MIQNHIFRRDLPYSAADGHLCVLRSHLRSVGFVASLICLSLTFAGCDREDAGSTQTSADDPASKAPADVGAVPADAQTTATGLASKVLRVGQGTTHPSPNSMVTVHYSGWTTDGKMFDSSVARGEPVTFPLNQVVAGWAQGVQLMVVGETRRLWIPEELAYKGRPGAPAGMLVFDVELISIQ